MKSIKLTEYSHGAGCGCKISPMLLDEILQTSMEISHFPNLLVGNSDKDDAAAFDLGNGTSVLSTTDFFMPIVDDAFIFGQIAATNALSDIYAMGGKPLMAISIFGWPIEKLSADVAREVIDGGRSICEEAGIPLAGGHSIDSPEPIFGLAVTGLVENAHLMQNSNAKEGCHIFLTKPLGIGILSTAQKQKKIKDGDIDPAIDAMTTLNKIGTDLAKLDGILSMTDVTGFGLLGHLVEICEASDISAEIHFDKVPLLPKVEKYRQLGCVPGGAKKNFISYGSQISQMTQQQREILCDAQTSGGLLVIVEPSGLESFMELTKQNDLDLNPIGKTTIKGKNVVEIL
ncbi:selenide, water dikinase SelD [Sulfurimonas aquatica]|uniref:Selenide, water dikinase n=1 Tax=Sulfurimonas aquatica TaxID=2672570 RepID=A0A975GCQ3_9BACT|nr:selenide, water dikinase SelD [Sulfurimonas aquatica]QSZ41946.1 selenide, water dikinase SelD [Sulfurimonas aquatica]